MNEKLGAIWRLCIAVLLYPLALAALIWIGWTGRSVLWGIGVIAGVLWLDQTWLFIVWRLVSSRKQK
jgi:hypothetical protein